MTTTDATNERRPRRDMLPSIVVGAYWTLLVYVMHVPLDREDEKIAELPKHSDKFVHLTAFGLLALLVCWACHERRRSDVARDARRPRRIAVGVLLFTVVYAAIDEALQPLTGRDGNVADFIADVIGAVLGVAAYLFIARLRTTRATGARKP